ncbi:MAG TPA: hypothetical protein PLK63_18075, partial [Catalimonadaceae bacterium]|nr:hypothetical protein [Catalimonadaceae bacterium]
MAFFVSGRWILNLSYPDNVCIQKTKKALPESKAFFVFLKYDHIPCFSKSSKYVPYPLFTNGLASASSCSL